MYKKRGSELFLNFVTRERLSKYFDILRGSGRKLFIPILSDGAQNHYYFEQHHGSKVATLRVFLDMEDVKEYIMGECSKTQVIPSDFNVLEANTDAAFESAVEVASAGEDLNASLRCVSCAYVDGELLEFDMFWTNLEEYFN